MKIKLIDKDNPITKLWCFNNIGFCQTTLDKINSGKQVTVDRVPKDAWNYVEEVKNKIKKNKGE